MDPLFYCPPAAALSDIPDFECAVRFDQVQRFFFQRIQSPSSFSAVSIKASATWTPLLAAVGDTKMVKTPRLPNVVIPPGEVQIEGGGDNTTLNGLPRLLGRNSVTMTIDLQDLDTPILSGLRALANESSGNTNIWMYMINLRGQIIANSDGSGIPAYNIMVGDLGSEGFNRPNIAKMTIGLAAGWSDDVVLFTPTAPFNPLTI